MGKCRSEFTLEQAFASAYTSPGTGYQQLPLGYNTLVGERSAMVSGGQRQKIASDQALIKNSAILIFDKATSALDIESEHQFQQNLTPIN